MARKSILLALVKEIIIGVLLFSSTSLLATERYVSPPGGYGTNDTAGSYTNWLGAATNISSAVNVSTDNDIIWVTNGVYSVNNPNWNSYNIYITHAITVKSMNGYAYTSINGNGKFYCVKISHALAVVDGFTISNGCLVGGTGESGGAGVYLASGGTVKNCYITGNNNLEGGWGGGICIKNGGMVDSCIVTGNYCSWRGGGIMLFGAPGEGLCSLRNSLVTGNSGVYGGGVYSLRTGQIQNCTIVGNASTNAAGGVNFEDDYPIRSNYVYNTIIYGNTCVSAPASSNVTGVGAAYFTNNCVAPTTGITGPGNTAQNPQFIDPAANYRLSANSPCINAGINKTWMTDTVDMDRRSRLDKFSAQVDMGCYEYIFKGSMVEIR